MLCTTREDALKAAKGNLKLSVCADCTYIWNRAYESGKHEYVLGYEISLHYSTVYQQFLEGLANRLIQDYQLQGKTILEIACGTGHFLRMLCRMGKNNGIGIDPVVERPGTEESGSNSITFIRDKFSEKYQDLECDFICCRQAIHAIENPKRIVQLVRQVIGENRKIPVYFEVVNGALIFSRQSIWQLIYEYYSFFTPEALTRLFSVCGFDVIAARPCYEDDQYLQIEANPARESRRSLAQSSANGSSILKDVETFSKGLRQKIGEWQVQLERIEKSGKRAIAWGAGGRGINFLNLVQASRSIPYIVDINPSRQGGYVPGTGQQVVAPNFLQEYRPDVVVVTNPTYVKEVRQDVEKMGLHCDFLSAS
jgi:SAM-dependent methyltransferase